MPAQDLNNLQKTDIFNAILEVGINPADVTFERLASYDVGTKLNIYGGHCSIYYYQHLWTLSMKPGIGRPSEYAKYDQIWGGKCMAKIKSWLKYMHDLHSTPDPWQRTISTPLPKVSEVSSVKNTLLSVAEYEKVSLGLIEIKKLFLEAAKSSAANQKEISERLDKVVEDGKTLGRKDWFNHIVAAMISLALTLALPSDVVKSGFEVLKESMNGIIEIAIHEANKIG